MAITTFRPADETTAPLSEQRVREQFDQALDAEEAIGRKFSTIAFLVGLAVISVWLFVQVGLGRVWYYQAVLGVFGLLIAGNYLWAESRYDQPWRIYAFLGCFLALLVVVIILPNPFVESWPIQTRLRFGNFLYVLLFLGPIALTFRPSAMIWAGFCAALAWAIGIAWVISLPDSKTFAGGVGIDNPTSEQLLAFFLGPHFVYVEAHVQDIVVVLLMAAVLALVVWRSRRLVLRQIGIARERANLARYFAPTVVDQLAQLDQPLGATRVQPVAVLFADIVGFSRLAEHSDPQEVVSTLRAFHTRLERAIFDHGGTLDKFLGDGVMATFGTPAVGQEDARNALSCALETCAAIRDWNRERADLDEPPIRLSIGIHYGPVVLGDIGSERRLEFAVLGDVVNVAQRLEGLTRRLDCRMVVSDSFVQTLYTQSPNEADRLLAGFDRAEPQTLRGREQPVEVWTLRAPSV
ncbi:MAG: adenylate/guanylate cyclase domain-containing protein [Pseudomonadota bacterium]